ncbi:carbon monoxide dehydrogenase subunit G [Neorhizobium galegae]|uniref:hypothetical protein n=1 Tax=Neorhizobium galegae TaxID=399 RepID=UPI00277E990A|nr:hypothetical protein [Neorhizobium galegae]MDQ0134325.1 carbon monoxide dehydrogenase subunit G [Neorhizobium galegae]
MTHERSASSTTIVSAQPEDVFAFLDDPTVFGAHMEKPSGEQGRTALAPAAELD